jgi:hypothetical protein
VEHNADRKKLFPSPQTRAGKNNAHVVLILDRDWHSSRLHPIAIHHTTIARSGQALSVELVL